MFVVLLKYTAPLTRIDALLDEHLAYLDRQYAAGKLIASGRRVPRTGGVILANAASEAELAATLAEDPFAREGVASYEIVEFTPSKFDPRFAPFVR